MVARSFGLVAALALTVQATYPIENYPVESYPVENYPVENYPVENYPVESYPVQSTTVVSVPTYAPSSKPAESYPAFSWSKPAESYPASKSKSEETATKTADTTVYTTVCPATSTYTVGTETKTKTYITTSTITSCKGGCPSTYVSKPTTSATPDCEKVRSDCQSKPDANQAFCAALYAKCAGTTSGLNKPSETYSATTVKTTVYTTVCPATSTYVHGNLTKTSTYITTSTITSCKGGCPSTNVPKPTSSAPSDCQDQYNKCRSPDGNQAYCAAEFAKCKGTNSYGTVTSTKPAVPTYPVVIKTESKTPASSPSKPAQTYPVQTKTTLASASTTTRFPTGTDSAPSATTSRVTFTGAAVAFKPAMGALMGAAALVVLV